MRVGVGYVRSSGSVEPLAWCVAFLPYASCGVARGYCQHDEIIGLVGTERCLVIVAVNRLNLEPRPRKKVFGFKPVKEAHLIPAGEALNAAVGMPYMADGLDLQYLSVRIDP